MKCRSYYFCECEYSITEKLIRKSSSGEMCCRLTINAPPLRRLETDVFAQRCALVVVHATIGLDWAPMYYPLLLCYAALFT